MEGKRGTQGVAICNGSMKSSPKAKRVLASRVTDPETARVVAVHRPSGDIVGAGCLVDRSLILTCRHVVVAALDQTEGLEGNEVLVTLAGVRTQPTVRTRVIQQDSSAFVDLALLEIIDGTKLDIAPVEFASPLRHGGKTFSVLGFPHNDQQGRNVSGVLHAVDAKGLVQMDCASPLLVEGGFSGAPVWSVDLGAFVGLVVTALFPSGVAWCIPSRVLCRFYNRLLVRFRIPPGDRPVIHDYSNDDPNAVLFGTRSNNGERRLTAKIWQQKGQKLYKVIARYERLSHSQKQRGGFVTFITYPDFTSEQQDRYEIFAELKGDSASVTFYPDESFTIAAIGDAGDTALTLHLKDALVKPPNFR
jgi:Trypsin-like peptidase domain